MIFKIDKKIIRLNEEDLRKDLSYFKEKLKDYEYISFIKGKCKINKFRDYLLTRALSLTNKDISCCDYSAYSEPMGEYLIFMSLRNLRHAKKEEFNKMVDLNQIAVKRDYFLRNLDKFRKTLSGKEIEFINEKNTAFIEIPLVSIELDNPKINTINKLNKLSIEKSFQFNFAVELYSLKARNRLFTSPYLYKILLWAMIHRNWFIIKYLLEKSNMTS
ncbi:hypothetical protein COV15_03180 [Candidatus Woesearchaeota archaeon CG10_big_fil_rev_8_21_14_0_10_34_12]|nr:MAG: hypothetical protein COV15_03180 [Candidatus Woesearchaeota archaeon CG10_big_fil_rev_8_21_14_0_10_34_12]